ncbi:TetR/AcrR family transcriptional regulator [Aegicerativicinus sediminis]
MEGLGIKLIVNPNLYNKNPESSDLGRSIISNSIEMILEHGFESFTFKKLGAAIGSNESSVYRYFDNKHNLLMYLINWYWSWMEYRLVFLTNNISDPKEKLETAITLLVSLVKEDDQFSFINESKLQWVLIAESGKVYQINLVDEENQQGFYRTYKRVVQRVSDMILDINPNYEFPHMLVSTIVEGANHQRFFSEHLPSLTDYDEKKDCVVSFYTQLVLNTLN